MLFTANTPSVLHYNLTNLGCICFSIDVEVRPVNDVGISCASPNIKHSGCPNATGNIIINIYLICVRALKNK
jgi:hypothetical protein